MALTVGENTWVTLVEADDYFTNRIGASSWFDLSETPASPGDNSKESFLVTAYYWLLYDLNYSLTASLTNIYVKNAQLESALFLLLNYTEYSKREAKIAGGVKKFDYSKWSETLNNEVDKPKIVNDILGKAGLGGYATYLVEIQIDD